MRKQELIHIHGLLLVTRRHLAAQERVEIPADAFDEYDDFGVGPTAIAKRKDAHKAAVDRLLAGLHSTLGTQRGTADASATSSEPSDASPARSS
jgi:hypothetical protein